MSSKIVEDAEESVVANASTPRGRYRSEVVAQIKELADRQLSSVGPAGLSLSAIARELGMSGPALYRYFASRDALLNALVTDAYNDLADELARRIMETAASDDRFRTLLVAYRRWAVTNPHRYRLLYQPPIPGFDPNEPTLVGASMRAMSLLLKAIAARRGHNIPVPAPLALSFNVWAEEVGLEVDPSSTLAAMQAWSRIHGFVSLEISGNFAIMTQDVDALFEAELDAMLSGR